MCPRKATPVALIAAFETGPVTIASANAAKVSTTPTTVTIPAGSYYAYFTVNGVDTSTSTSLIAQGLAPAWRDYATDGVRTGEDPAASSAGGCRYSPIRSGRLAAKSAAPRVAPITNMVFPGLPQPDTVASTFS